MNSPTPRLHLHRAMSSSGSDCLLRTRRWCRREACRAAPTCPVKCVSTSYFMVDPQIRIAWGAFHPPRPIKAHACATAIAQWSARKNDSTHLGLVRHVEESRGHSDNVGERDSSSASSPAEELMSLDVHVWRPVLVLIQCPSPSILVPASELLRRPKTSPALLPLQE